MKRTKGAGVVIPGPQRQTIGLTFLALAESHRATAASLRAVAAQLQALLSQPKRGGER